LAKYEEVKKGIKKRTNRRVLGLFIDGTGLDRATRRIKRKVDMTALIRGVTSGIQPLVSRYYTLIPYEDDSRQRAFLDAVGKAGLDVVVKRLPPKGVSRQVGVDVEMAADMIAFAMGHSNFGELSLYKSVEYQTPQQSVSMMPGKPGQLRPMPTAEKSAPPVNSENDSITSAEERSSNGTEQRIVTVVCPSRDLAYPTLLVRELGVDTVTADFGKFNTNDILKSAAKWIDLSDSETIWRD